MPKRTRTFVVLFLIAGALGAAILTPLAVGHNGPLTLNQTIVEHDLMNAGAFRFDDRVRSLRSRYSAGLDRLINGRDADVSKVDLDEPVTVLRYILASAPPVAVVYPTETYFYYTFRLRDRVISGNVRLLDADSGLLHIGYFDKHETSTMNSATFGPEDGIEIKTLAPHRYRVTFEGRSTEFILPTRFLDRPESLELLEHEEFITSVLDESGVALTLLYNNVLNGFFFVVNPDVPLSEARYPIEGGDGRYFVGERTRFVYYDDPDYERSVLVGVDADNIRMNNYFDGPFDQVPPRLSIGDRLRAAYPYTNYRGGIDDHGNFLELDGQRVAISPYQAYEDLHSLVRRLVRHEETALVAAERWNRMTYEPKREFDPTDAEEAAAKMPAWHAQGWPPNHWGHLSRMWPADHTRSASLNWPANHETPASRGTHSGAGAMASSIEPAGPPSE